MGRNSGIEWTEHTFNPWWGCQKVSPGCENCYADTFSARFHDNLWGPPAHTNRRTFGDKHWNEPVRWNAAAEKAGKPARVFCASMADVFEDAPQVDTERQRLWQLIESTPWLVWLLLTKRPENTDMVPADWGVYGWPPNVWMGTSVEDQERADERIPSLLRAPADVHFVSAEPLLGPVTIRPWLHDSDCAAGEPHDVCWCPGELRERRVDWVIVGGESGPGARPMDARWVRDLRRQCAESPAAFFFKQWGAHDQRGERVGKKHAGRTLDGRAWSDVPALPSPSRSS